MPVASPAPSPRAHCVGRTRAFLAECHEFTSHQCDLWTPFVFVRTSELDCWRVTCTVTCVACEYVKGNASDVHKSVGFSLVTREFPHAG